MTAYGRIAPSFACVAAQRKAYLERVDALVIAGVPPGSRSLLDVGAGDGTRALRIARTAGVDEVTLLEPSAEMRRRWAADVTAWTMRAEDLRTAQGRFDVITCLWNVIGHIFPASNRTEVLRQFARLLAPGGKVFFDVSHRYNASHYGTLPTLERLVYDWILPNERNGDVPVAWDLPEARCETIGHVFTHKELCRIMQAAGLRIEQRYVIDYASGALMRWGFQGHLLYCLRRT